MVNNKDIYHAFLKAVGYLVISVASLYVGNTGVLLALLLIIFSFIKKKDILEPIIIFTIIFSTNVLELIEYEQIPVFSFGPGMSFSILEIMIFPMAIHSMAYLKMNNIKSESKNIVLVICAFVIIYLLFGIIKTGSISDGGAFSAKYLLYVLFYFVFVEYFTKNPDNKLKLLYIIGFICVLGTVLQLYEFFQNQRILLPGFARTTEYYNLEGVKIFSGGNTDRIYMWGRTIIYSFISIAIFFSMIVYKVGHKFSNYIIFLTSILSFAIASVRIYMIIVFLCVLLVVLLNTHKKSGFVSYLLIFLIVFTVLIQLSAFAEKLIGFDFIGSFTGRIESIFSLGDTYGENDTFTGRVVVTIFLLNKFYESPIFGFGYGLDVYRNYQNGDVGIINQLIRFGLLGTLPIIFFIFNYIRKAYIRLKSNLYDIDKVFLLSAIVVLISHLPAYIWQIDFWSSRLAIGLLLVIALSDSVLMQKIDNLNNK